MVTYLSKIAEKPTPLSFGTFFGGDRLRIFRRVIPCQKLDLSDGVDFLFHDPAFAPLGTIPASDTETDGHVAIAKTALCIATRGQKRL